MRWSRPRARGSIPTGSSRPTCEAFQVELDAEGKAHVVVRLRAVLISDADRRIRGARSFERRVPATSTDEGAVVPAFEAATTAVLSDVAQWTVATVR